MCRWQKNACNQETLKGLKIIISKAAIFTLKQPTGFQRMTKSMRVRLSSNLRRGFPVIHNLSSTGFLNCGVDNLFKCGSKPLRDILPILKRIRLAIPKMKRIWGSSAMSKQGRDQILDRALMIEKEALEMIEKGHFTLDDCMIPQ